MGCLAACQPASKMLGKAIRHSWERIFFYTAGSRKGLTAEGRAGKWVNLGQKSLKSGFDPKVKSPKMGLSSPLDNFWSDQPFFAIFGPARGQIYKKNAEKVRKIMVLVPLGLVTLVAMMQSWPSCWTPFSSCKTWPHFLDFGPILGHLPE